MPSLIPWRFFFFWNISDLKTRNQLISSPRDEISRRCERKMKVVNLNWRRQKTSLLFWDRSYFNYVNLVAIVWPPSSFLGSSVVAEYSGVKPWSQDWLIAAGAYPGFYDMKRLEVFLLPLDGDASPSQGTSLATCQVSPTICRYSFIHLGGERQCENKVSCPRTQHSVPGQGSNPDPSLRGRAQ